MNALEGLLPVGDLLGSGGEGVPVKRQLEELDSLGVGGLLGGLQEKRQLAGVTGLLDVTTLLTSCTQGMSEHQLTLCLFFFHFLF